MKTFYGRVNIENSDFSTGCMADQVCTDFISRFRKSPFKKTTGGRNQRYGQGSRLRNVYGHKAGYPHEHTRQAGLFLFREVQVKVPFVISG